MPSTIRLRFTRWRIGEHTRIELVPQDRQSSILTIRPMHQLIEQIMRIELTSSAWQADTLTVVLYLQDEMCPSSQTSTLFTKALDFSRYCCGSGRIRTYSARRQQIYSPPQLWRTPLNNGINKTQTQSRSLNVSEYKDSAVFRLYKVNNVKFCNNRIYCYIPS